MKKFRIDESEKERILNMHVSATKKQYLKEDIAQGMTNIQLYNFNRGVQCFLIGAVPDGVWGSNTMNKMPKGDKEVFKECISEYGDIFDKLSHWLGLD